MLNHNKCGTAIYINATKYFKILVVPGIGEKALKLSMGNIEIVDEGKTKPSEFYCLYCNCEVGIGEISIRCSSCGKEHSVQTVVKAKKQNGDGTSLIFCRECSAKYDREFLFEPFGVIVGKVQISSNNR